MAPTTAHGKLFASIFALMGIVLVGLVLGVVGSQLVEAEIKYTEKVTSKTSKVLERTFTRKNHHQRKNDKEKMEYNGRLATNMTLLRRTDSLSSLESLDSINSESTCCSARDLASLESQISPTHSLSPRSRHRLEEKEEGEESRRCTGLSVIWRHLPGFAPMLVGA